LGAQSEPLTIVKVIDPKKAPFGPSKWPHKLKTAKNSKLPKLPKTCFESVEKSRWPSISTWIKNLNVEKYNHEDSHQCMNTHD
jgi:hypothetical protein